MRSGSLLALSHWPRLLRTWKKITRSEIFLLDVQGQSRVWNLWSCYEREKVIRSSGEQSKPQISVLKSFLKAQISQRSLASWTLKNLIQEVKISAGSLIAPTEKTFHSTAFVAIKTSFLLSLVFLLVELEASLLKDDDARGWIFICSSWP